MLTIPRKICYQKLQKEKHREWERIKNFDPSSKEIREISYKEAKELILKYEWLGTMPSSPWKNYGLFMNDTLVAVECFTKVRSGNTRYTYLGYPAICLARGASIANAPSWVGSYLISKALKLLTEELNGEPHYVLAYSDWEGGELGTIYQACSWVYTGHKQSPEWRSPDGKRKDSSYHRCISRRIDPNYKIKRKLNPEIVEQSKQRLLAEGWKKEKTVRGRYVKVIGYNSKLKREMLKELSFRSLPYIKEHNYEIAKELTEAQVKKLKRR